MSARPAPPQPPKPPELRCSCSGCGYTAPESEYERNHPYCKLGRTVEILLPLIVIGLLGLALLANPTMPWNN